MEEKVQSGFIALGVHKNLAWRLSQEGIVEPTPIQAGAIPIALESRDVIGLAQTGTGKTLAFGIPMSLTLQRGEVGLVLAPTRELAQQIAESLRILDVHTVLVVGGAPMGRQVKELRMPHEVVVATPGRLMDHLRQRTYRLNRIRIAVLDEADRMLDMGFAPDIKEILSNCPEPRQTMLFSATMPAAIEDLAMEFLVSPTRIECAKQGTASELVDQELVYLRHEQKFGKLNEILDEADGTFLVFSRTRHGARKLALALREEGHTAAEIHSDRTLAQRREALGGFKSGKYRILVATDIAARGIDVKDISVVVNYDVPEHSEDYVHRIGRTGRAGARGRAITMALPGQKRLIRNIERLMGKQMLEGGQIRKPKPSHRDNGNYPSRKPVEPHTPVSDRTYEVREEKPRFEKSKNDGPRFDKPRNDKRRDDRPRFDKPRDDRPRNDRPRDDRPRFDRPQGDRPQYDRPNRPQFKKVDVKPIQIVESEGMPVRETLNDVPTTGKKKHRKGPERVTLEGATPPRKKGRHRDGFKKAAKPSWVGSGVKVRGKKKRSKGDVK